MHTHGTKYEGEREREEEQKISLSIKLSTSFSLTTNIDNIRDQRSLRGKGEDGDVYSLLPDLDHVRFKTLHSSKLQGSFLLRQATFLGRQFVPGSDLFPVDTIKFIKRISSGWLVFVY